jgi:flagellar hook-basal body complex protein FliE
MAPGVSATGARHATGDGPMAIEPLGMEALLAKLNAMRDVTKGVPVATPKQAAKLDFASALKETLGRVEGAQATAASQAERFQLGDPKVTLEETMVSLAKANVSFQQLVQVRNKVVAAYHDIMNMQI